MIIMPIIISMEHAIIDEEIKQTGQIPTTTQILSLFEERYTVKQTEVYEQNYKYKD